MIKISKSTQEEIKEFNIPAWIEADKELYGEQNIWIEEDFVFKAEEDEKIWGSIYGKFAAGVLYIDDLIVAKNQRRKGIGKILIEKAEEWGKGLGAHKAYLVTKKEENSAAIKLYKKQGYTKTGEFKDHYHHFDFLIYEKPI